MTSQLFRFQRANRGAMMNAIKLLAIGALTIAPIYTVSSQQSRRPLAAPLEAFPTEAIAPVVLCIDEKADSPGQPSSQAYARAAANGFRSVLTLRSKQDRADLARERLIVEQNKLRYFNLPAGTRLPPHEQIDKFLQLARDPANQPMLVNCAFANRVAPLMMMFRILEQGWSEEKAIEEASRSGLAAAQLSKFARAYLTSRQKIPSHS